MAKPSKNSHVVSDIPEGPRQEKIPGSEPASIAERVPLTTEQVRALFDTWKAADAHLTSIKATVDAAAQKKSDAAKAIVEAVGNKGPWTIDGARLSVTVRGDRYNIQRESDAKLTL